MLRTSVLTQRFVELVCGHRRRWLGGRNRKRNGNTCISSNNASGVEGREIVDELLGRGTSPHYAYLAGLLLLLASPAAGLEVPYLSGRVVDEANLLSAESEQRITARLAKLEEEKGAQMVVLTIDSLEGEDLEQFSIRVAETWELGRKEVDDGVLLLVVPGERQMRLEVGYGLEPVLTDLLSRRVLDEVLKPRFRAGEFEQGIEEGVETVVKIIGGAGEDALPPPAETSGGGGLSDWSEMLVMGLMLLFFSPFVLMLLFARETSWLLYLFMVPFVAAFPGALLGGAGPFIAVGLWLVGVPLLRIYLKRKGWATWNINWSSGSGSSGSSWSSSSSSYSSSSSSSSSSFSGGGGSFGGGGASSSW